MKIEGSIRSNLLAAIGSARRWRGKQVHSDTLRHWQLLLEHAGRMAAQPYGEAVGDLVVQLEGELSARQHTQSPLRHELRI